MRSRGIRLTTAAATAVALALVAAACGGNDGDDTATGTVDEGVRSGVESQLGVSTTAPADAAPEPRSMQEWEALWAEERAAIVQRIKDNGWGVSADGRTVTGPEGFTADLTKCAAGWSPTEGLTDTEIRYGFPAPMSGTSADFGNIPRTTEVILDHYASQGAFTDANGRNRSVNLIVRDDAYDPARTVPLVDEMLDSDKVFGITNMGSPNTFKVYDKLNQRCVPESFVVTGHPAWGDPVNHPWTTGSLLSYSTEAVLWGSFIEQRLDEWGGSAKVASLRMSNDFGKAYDSSFRAFLAQSPRKADIDYVSETIEPTAPTVKDPMTTLAAQQPTVFLAMLTGTACTQVITEAAENGLKEELDAGFMPSVCKASTFVGKDKVGGDGTASDGWWIIGGGYKDYNAAAFDSDPWVAFTRDLLSRAGYDYRTSGNFGLGTSFGWTMAQALQVAGQLPGGLTRPNFLVAVRSLDMTNPMLVSGVKFNMDGNRDAYFIEGSDVSQWDAAQQQWAVKEVVELSGASKLCPWDIAAGVCR